MRTPIAAMCCSILGSTVVVMAQPSAPAPPATAAPAAAPAGTGTATVPAPAPAATPEPPPEQPASADDTAPAERAEESGLSHEAPSPYANLPENPAVAAEPLTEAPAPKPRRKQQRIDLGLGVGVSHRSVSTSEIDVDPGPSLRGHARIAFNEWLGLTALAAVETHGVSISTEAFGFEGLAAEQGTLRMISLGAELSPRFRLGSQWSVHAGAGLAWTRLEAGEMNATEPVEFALDPRTGSMLELVLEPRLGLRWTEHIGTSLWGRAGLPLLQSGDVFASGASELQTVRRDDGRLLSVGGFPEFSHTFSGHLSLDIFF